MKVCKIFTFDAAHKLPGHNAECKNLHGHTYKLEVIVSGKIDKNTGMVMDFKELSDIVNMHVIDRLDHTYLNDIYENPTAENIAVHIHDILYTKIYGIEEFTLIIRLWETPTSWVQYP